MSRSAGLWVRLRGIVDAGLRCWNLSPKIHAARLRTGYPTQRRFLRRGQFKVLCREFGLLVGLPGKPLAHIQVRIEAEATRGAHHGHHGAAGPQLDRLSCKELLFYHFCSFSIAVGSRWAAARESQLQCTSLLTKSEGKANQIYCCVWLKKTTGVLS